MKKKIFSLTLLAIIAFGGLASVYGYQEYLYRWEDEGEGAEHGGCAHGGADAAESAIGTLTVTLETTGDINPYDEIEISFDILNFTEATEVPYENRFTHGIAGYRGDNAEFLMNNSHQYINRGERVDGTYGSYVDDSDAEYILYAPKAAGTYDLVVTAMAAMNNSLRDENLTWGVWFQEEMGDDVKLAYPIVYVEGTIQIVVVGTGAGDGGGSIPGFLTLVLTGSIGITVLAVVLRVRRKKRIVK